MVEINIITTTLQHYTTPLQHYTTRK